MKIATALVLMFSVWITVSAGAETMEEKTARADRLFQAGRFPEAETAFREAIGLDPRNRTAALGLGRVLLFRNALEESEGWLTKAAAMDTTDRTAMGLLAEAHYRRSEFAKAAECLEAMGAAAKAAACRRLAEKPVFVVQSGQRRTVVPFLQTDPLPLVRMSVNGEEAFLLIDTGAAEISLNADLAERIGLEKLGEQTATYAGGLQAKTWRSAAETVEIGGLSVRNVPVVISERGVQSLPGFIRPISGIIGTAFLYHFVFTLDYPGGALILEEAGPRPAADSPAAIRVPFWLCGDHYMMAWGRVNKSPAFLFIDTGMAGGGFTVAERMLKESGIVLPEAAQTGIGGGGAVQVRRIRADLALGDVCEPAVDGFFGVMAPGMEAVLGHRLDGIISHGFFRGYRCTFDFSSMTLTMEKGGKTE